MEQSKHNNSNTEQQQLDPIDSESTTTEKIVKKKGAFPTWVDLLAILGIFLVGQLVAQVVISIMGFEVVSHDQIASVMTEVRRNLQFEMGRTTLYYSLLAQPLVLLLVIIYRQIRGGEWKLGFSVRGFNPTILLWGFIMLLSTVIVIEPLMQFLPESQAPVGR